MFTKENLEKWIEAIENSIKNIKNHLTYDKEEVECLVDLKKTLEALHTSITSDESI